MNPFQTERAAAAAMRHLCDSTVRGVGNGLRQFSRRGAIHCCPDRPQNELTQWLHRMKAAPAPATPRDRGASVRPARGSGETGLDTLGATSVTRAALLGWKLYRT